MTKEQAIKLLRSESSIQEIHRLKDKGLSHNEVTDAIQEAMDMGAEAMELQEPKKPRGSNNMCYCPNCGVSVTGMGFRFCVECGQALDI